MSAESYFVSQGAAFSIDVTLKDQAGVAATGFTGAETLGATLSEGDTAPVLFVPASGWLDPDVPSVTLSGTASQTATLLPGAYLIRIRVGTGDGRADAYTAILRVTGAPGGLPSPTIPTIVTPAFATDNIPGFDPSSTGCMQLLRDATDAINASLFRVIPLTSWAEKFNPRWERHRPRTVQLREYPVRSLTVCTAPAVGLTVGNDGTLYRASATLTAAFNAGTPGAIPTGITLAGYLSGVPSPSSLAFEDYPTLGSLVDAINALGDGWSATTPYDDFPCVEVAPDYGTKGTAATYCVYTETLDQYELDPATGEVRFYGTTPTCRTTYPGYSTLMCRNDAGYSDADMPHSLKRACCIVAKGMAQKSDYGLVTQQKSGDQFANSSPTIMQLVEDMIKLYRRVRVY